MRDRLRAVLKGSGTVAAAVVVVFSSLQRPALADTLVASSEHVTVEASTTSARPGDQVTFTVTVTNDSGSGSTAFAGVFADTTLFDSPGTCTVITGPTPTSCQIGSSGRAAVVECAPGCVIPAGTALRARITTTVAAIAAPGVHTVTPSGGLHDFEPWTPATFPFTVLSEADIAVGLTAVPGPALSGTITYTQTATNNGPATTTAGTVITTLPAQATGVTGLPAHCGYTAATKKVACDLTALANGATTTNTFAAQLSPVALGTQSATATRTTSTPTDPAPGNDTATATCSATTSLLISC
ncbi:DUF11 domain-containing protein [Actinokineospora cianjurensis]|uniref:Putative repeat protein (TIGR01451 family) n=1 Tax=Actinokineospora cianjurensis TaxID=585224 RepID=A0A421B2R7_9PSEU|nr:DUF11 domain-containing protein [Actinokineospora cianjurensis]RLK58558.1 putative repeat protein (TIGR01451 family) [Actinokineospora cianjurensis]